MPDNEEQRLELVDELASQARFIFVGTVERRGAATMAQIPVTADTAIVQVDRVLHAPAVLRQYQGQRITVQLVANAGPRDGEQAVFYTNSTHYGTSLNVQSVGHTGLEGIMAETGDPARNLADRDLRAHLSDADLVITGRVREVRLPTEPAVALTAPAGGSGASISEHDPLWREAVVEVASVEKGSYAAPDLVVRFPASVDVMWYKAPKFHPGQAGVFSVHSEQVAETVAASTGMAGPGQGQRYVALHDLDFQPMANLPTIKAMIASPTAPQP